LPAEKGKLPGTTANSLIRPWRANIGNIFINPETHKSNMGATTDKKILIDFSQSLIDLMEDFKEEMEILNNSETQKQIADSLKSSETGTSKKLSLKELKDELVGCPAINFKYS